MSNKNKKILICLRGPCGSGKSFTARQKCLEYGADPRQSIFSTDQFWIQDYLKLRSEAEKAADFDKAYWDELEKDTYRANWNPSLLGKAHGWNFWKVSEAIQSGLPLIIVDNTNIIASHMSGYAKLAESNGYEVLIQEPTSPWWLDHRTMLYDKQTNGTALEDFARFLAGFHQGMEAKYGAKGNTHGVPLDTIRSMIRKWQTDLTADDITGRSGRFS